jgi:hypothetical protein
MLRAGGRDGRVAAPRKIIETKAARMWRGCTAISAVLECPWVF